jgi:hypothetical protein
MSSPLLKVNLPHAGVSIPASVWMDKTERDVQRQRAPDEYRSKHVPSLISMFKLIQQGALRCYWRDDFVRTLSYDCDVLAPIITAFKYPPVRSATPAKSSRAT